jgi:hypothetical protein
VHQLLVLIASRNSIIHTGTSIRSLMYQFPVLYRPYLQINLLRTIQTLGRPVPSILFIYSKYSSLNFSVFSNISTVEYSSCHLSLFPLCRNTHQLISQCTYTYNQNPEHGIPQYFLYIIRILSSIQVMNSEYSVHHL